MQNSGLGYSKQGQAFPHLHKDAVGSPNHIVMGVFPFKGRPHRGESFSDLLENIMGRYVAKIFGMTLYYNY